MTTHVAAGEHDLVLTEGEDELWQAIDEAARFWLGITGDEFVALHAKGAYDGVADDGPLAGLVMMLPRQ